MIKTLPLKTYPTPFHIYDERGILDTATSFKKAFNGIPGFRNYFAVKALPNPEILKLLYKNGMGMDCSSMAELMLCEKIGITGENIMFTSNGTHYSEYRKALALGAIINLDDINHVEYIKKHAHIPDLISFRYNPGSSRIAGSQPFIIGKPEDAKFGETKKHILKGYETAKKLGIKRFGIHAMIASNELDWKYFVGTAKMLFELIVEIHIKLGIVFDFVNLGGGIGIPYKPGQKPIDLYKISDGIINLYKKYGLKKTMPNFRIYMENGRAITGPHGILVTRVLHVKQTYKTFVFVDATMVNLMRPGMYGAYHRITVFGKKNTASHTYDVVGSLCENNDKFAIDRKLPKINPGDILVIHDTGAHGHAMGFNYNGKLRSAELLFKKNGKIELIRRAETPEDYFKTLTF